MSNTQTPRRNGDKILFQTWLPESLVKRLRHATIDEECRMQDMVEDILIDWLDEHYPELDRASAD